MTLWEALLLGLVQGVTEFFPISSSGHLLLTEHFLGFSDLKALLFFDLVCHIGTLGAIFVFFRKEIQEALLEKNKALPYLVALIPLFALLPFLKWIKSFFERPDLLGYGFLATATTLYMGQRFAKEALTNASTEAILPEGHPPKMKAAFCIGVSQALAILPGVSRSGMTISTARVLGVTPHQAVAFSFLLSIPTVLGATALELFKISNSLDPLPDVSLTAYLAGSLCSFIFGLLSLKLLIRIVGTARFQLFAWYLVFIGLATLYIFH